MIKVFWQYAVRSILFAGGVAGLLLVNNCGDTKTTDVSQQDTSASVDGKPMGPAKAPKKALFGQYYKDPATGRTWIYDGANWVPRDNTVDDYYKQLAASATMSKVLSSMSTTEVFPTCTAADATGAHTKHSGFDCKVCHKVGGVLCFDPNGAAYSSPTATILPSFDANTKTCSNVACHGVKAGTFSYYFPGNEDNDGDGYPDAELKTVHYGGTLAASTPSWYITPGTGGCTACHGNPPVNGSDGSNNWHSSFHANNQNVGPIGPNACELCHNDPTKPYPTYTPIALSAVGTDGKVHGYQINAAAASQHANGTATVYAKFVSQCFNCH
jgi:hypothetical protein